MKAGAQKLLDRISPSFRLALLGLWYALLLALVLFFAHGHQPVTRYLEL